MSHPLWSHFDIEFKNFNSATLQWPGGDPFTARQLQTSHTNLYQPANNECYLFDNLSKLGFTQHLMMGHNASSAVLKEVRENGGMQMN